MKAIRIFSIVALIAACLPLSSTAKDDKDTSEVSSKLSSMHLQMLNFDTTGVITLANGVARFEVPKGFKYLDAKQSQHVLHDIWGNPPTDETLGMIFPTECSNLIPNTWGIEITYEESGHVKDDDAKDIKYDELLKDIQDKVEEENPKRKEAGYPTFKLLGWASPPYYDSKSKKLHWAKRLKFEDDSLETLNYNIRILGRKGVLVLNAIGRVDELNEIKTGIDPILASVNFNDGSKYSDFDSNIDKVAAYGIGGLIAGGVLLKTGLLSKLGLIMLKFIKPIILGVGVVASGIWRFITGKKKDDTDQA